MARHTISRQSVSGYLKQGWLEPVMSGVYRRPFSSDTNPEAVQGWKIPLLSAVWLMRHEFHVDGASSLSLRGHTHYLSFGSEFALYLYGSDIPTWLSKLWTDADVKTRSNVMLGEGATGVENADFDLSNGEDPELAQSPALANADVLTRARDPRNARRSPEGRKLPQGGRGVREPCQSAPEIIDDAPYPMPKRQNQASFLRVC